MMRRRFTKIALLSLVVGAGIMQQVSACSVPVFRYALERWERDEYRLLIASKGDLNTEESKIFEDLKKENYYEDGSCNIGTFHVDITNKEESAEILKKYPELKDITETTAFLLYPRGSYLPKIIWKEKISHDIVGKLTSSPFIKEVMTEILKGTSAVWIQVDSGNKEKDDKAFKILKDTLKRLSEEIEMPAGVIETSGNITGGMTEQEVMANYDPANFLKSGIPLKINFTVKRLTRDKDETLLRSLLMNIEDDLKEYDGEPMAFPFFGRGRFLVPMIGDGINVENVEMATSYLCGACSCQVKDQNPGVDILSNIDWYSYLEGSEVVIDKELPPLTGTADLADVVEEPQSVEVVEEEVIIEPTSTVNRNLMIALAVIILIIVGASLKAAKKD